MLDLLKVTGDFIAKHGIERTIEVTGASASAVRQWTTRKSQPRLENVQHMLEYDPDPIHAIQPFYQPTSLEPGKIVLYTTTNRPLFPEAVICREQALLRHREITPILRTSNFLVRQRNRFMNHFVSSSYEWSIWADDDVVFPWGDAAYFKEMCGCPYYPSTYAGIDSITRLLSCKKTLIGACYFGRKPGSHAMFAEAFAGGTMGIDTMLHNAGPRAETRPTAWIGFGLMAIHRSVPEDIIKTHPEILGDPEISKVVGYTHGFFDPAFSGGGEDTSFCARAKKAGHQAFVDLAVFAGHIGPHVFTYYTTRPQPRVA